MYPPIRLHGTLVREFVLTGDNEQYEFYKEDFIVFFCIVMGIQYFCVLNLKNVL